MLKIHTNLVNDWNIWYSPRLRKWCGLHKNVPWYPDITINEKSAILGMSKGAVVKLIKEYHFQPTYGTR